MPNIHAFQTIAGGRRMRSTEQGRPGFPLARIISTQIILFVIVDFLFAFAIHTRRKSESIPAQFVNHRVGRNQVHAISKEQGISINLENLARGLRFRFNNSRAPSLS